MTATTLDQGYAVCAVCRHVYRPDVQASVDGHRQATGHAPRAGTGPPRPEVRAASPSPGPGDGGEAPVTGAQLLLAATRRAADLQAVVDGLDALVLTWDRSDSADVRQCGRMLAAYLARPPIRARGDDAQDDVAGGDVR